MHSTPYVRCIVYPECVDSLPPLYRACNEQSVNHFSLRPVGLVLIDSFREDTWQCTVHFKKNKIKNYIWEEIQCYRPRTLFCRRVHELWFTVRHARANDIRSLRYLPCSSLRRLLMRHSPPFPSLSWRAVIGGCQSGSLWGCAAGEAAGRHSACYSRWVKRKWGRM